MEDIEDVINRHSFDDIPDEKIKAFVIDLVELSFNTQKEFEKVIRKISRIHKLKLMPSKPGILQMYKKLYSSGEIQKHIGVEQFCIKKRKRSDSGVLVITVLTSPFPEYTTADGIKKTQSFSCGYNCSYCPNQPEIITNTTIVNAISSEDDEHHIVSVIGENNNMFLTGVLNYIDFPEYNIQIDRIHIKNIKKHKNEVLQTYNTFDIEIKATKIDFDKLKPGIKIIGTTSAQPRSYISSESAVKRGNRNHFDAYKQFIDRISGLEMCGHPLDKIEILVLGGTWSNYPLNYKDEFIRDLHYAANTYYDILQGIKRERLSLDEEMKLNMNASCRIIGLTLETRPDCINKREIIQLRKYNCTRVQLGVQHIDDEILKNINRKCYLKDTIRAIRLLKDNAFKIDIHIMPDLPGSNIDKDKDMFNKFLGVTNTIKENSTKHNYEYILSNPELQADQWKIYPCEVTNFTDIKKWYDEGSYKPYGEDESLMIELILKVKTMVFPWIRLNRVIRDFEFNSTVVGGNLNPNIRNVLDTELKKRGEYCKCIRCREVGNKETDISKAILVIRKYNTYGGIEYFLSFESPDYKIIYGFLRLRINESNEFIFFEALKDAALIRELHVYGPITKHDDQETKKIQHQGFGKALLKEAERIASDHGLRNIAVISGIGVREYYGQREYNLNGTYMIKKLDEHS